jgi:glycosyltransferase involved in cell wall biosynthesis
MIKFSIVIPIYNTSAFLEKTVRSCMNQTYSNLEIICIDDCSTDNSVEIIESLKNIDKRIKFYFHPQNLSQYIARRTGVENSTGDYILFLDSDDTLELDACALLSKKITDTHSDIIQFGYREVPKRKNIFPPFYKTSQERISAYLAKENRYSPAVWAKAYSRTLINNAFNSMDVFYASGSEDIYTSIVLAYYAKSFSLLKKPLINYSVTTGWSTRRVFSINVYRTWLESYQTVILKTREFITANMPEFIPKCLDMEIYLLKDFIFCRIAPQLSREEKHEVFNLFPLFFSEESRGGFYDELLQKYSEYETYLNYNVPFKSKSKKIIKVFLRCLKSIFVYDPVHNYVF